MEIFGFPQKESGAKSVTMTTTQNVSFSLFCDQHFWCQVGTTCSLGKTLCPTLKGWKWEYLVFHRKSVEPRVLPWQQLRRCHSLSFVIPISGAKFEEHRYHMSRDIVDWVLCCFSGTIYDVLNFLICIMQKRKYLYNEKRYSKKVLYIYISILTRQCGLTA